MVSRIDLVESITCNTHVKGLTHNFYRYPARFSPVFARTIIQKFSKPGDVVLDPFMGGGTTLVEAIAAGRHAIGTDINELAVFISEVKTSVLSEMDIAEIKLWTESLPSKLNFHSIIVKDKANEYPLNLSLRHTWRIRRILELLLSNIRLLSTHIQRQFAKCAALNTAQWALDSKTKVPSVSEFRERLYKNIDTMISGMIEFKETITRGGISVNAPDFICRSAVGIENEERFKQYAPPSLVLTSPPYPGIHVLYHRWQILGRKETTAPYWISNCMDGCGASYYTFGDRKQKKLTKYFEQATQAFSSIAKILDSNSTVVQMVAFSDPTWQLPAYLNSLVDAGLEEVFLKEFANSEDGRIWRTVPNRKWQASVKGNTPSSKEVVLFHKLSG